MERLISALATGLVEAGLAGAADMDRVKAEIKRILSREIPNEAKRYFSARDRLRKRKATP